MTRLNGWLNQLQATMSGKITVIYDACESGTFLSALSGVSRAVITSTPFWMPTAMASGMKRRISTWPRVYISVKGLCSMGMRR